MRFKHKGFTLVEVALFMALTAAIFIGVMAGTQNTVWHQKFNDSVQDFAEFMRGVYSQVSNPQSIGTGQNDIAIYGKLVVFGESYGLDHQPITDHETRVYVYDVVGDVVGTGSGNVQSMLSTLKANVVMKTYNNGALQSVVPAGIVQSYLPKWMSTIEATSGYDDKGYLMPFKGSILVVRHPKSGTINTLVSNNVIEVNKAVTEASSMIASGVTPNNVDNLLTSQLGTFGTHDVDFCINLDGQDKYSGNLRDLLRRDVRLKANTRNASGVEVIDLDLDKKENGVQVGNRCRYGD